MRKLFHRVLVCTIIAAFFWICGAVLNRQIVQKELLQIDLTKETVLSSMHQNLEKISDIQESEAYLAEMLPKIREIYSQKKGMFPIG